jgi:hypothetical protein
MGLLLDIIVLSLSRIILISAVSIAYSMIQFSLNFELISQCNMKCFSSSITLHWGRRGRDRMVVGFTTTCAISAYHH